MKIVLFDDNAKDLDSLVQIVERWGAQRNCKDLILYKFDSLSTLEFSLQDLQFSDVFFLDIMTPESSNAGFQLAESIHIANPNANIVFTTNSPEYWSNAFEIYAMHYLMKPIPEDKMFKVLDCIYRSPSKRASSAAILPGGGQEFVIEFDQILYIEAKTEKHQGFVHLIDGEKREINLSSVSFSGLLNDRLSEDFAQCHRSIIVNLNYVLKYDRRTVTLRHCNRELSIGQNYRNVFLSRLINHQKGLRAYDVDNL